MYTPLQNSLLHEIFIPASTEILTDRFSETNNAASCGGSCKSGHCMGFIEDQTTLLTEHA
jgi:hypothetical protein